MHNRVGMHCLLYFCYTSKLPLDKNTMLSYSREILMKNECQWNDACVQTPSARLFQVFADLFACYY